MFFNLILKVFRDGLLASIELGSEFHKRATRTVKKISYKEVLNIGNASFLRVTKERPGPSLKLSIDEAETITLKC